RGIVAGMQFLVGKAEGEGAAVLGDELQVATAEHLLQDFRRHADLAAARDPGRRDQIAVQRVFRLGHVLALATQSACATQAAQVTHALSSSAHHDANPLLKSWALIARKTPRLT